MPSTDPWDLDRLRQAALAEGAPWREIIFRAETGSTNTDLAAMARAGADPGTVLIADRQTAGRGRLGRGWETPAGAAVAMSVLLRPSLPLASWTWLPLAAGVAVADAVHGVAHVAAELKWPNDVVVQGRKLCGILAERVDTPGGPACVLGMGINVGLAAAELPVATATSLRVLLGQRCPSRTDVGAAVLAALDLVYGRLEAAGPAAVRGSYARRCGTLGRAVRVELADGAAVEGQAETVDDSGRLVVVTGTGPRAFSAGDVVHLR